MKISGSRFLSMATAAVVGMMVSGYQAQAKPIKKKYGTTQNGKMPEQLRNDMASEIEFAQRNMTDQHYEDIIADPQKARNDQERLASLSAREVFILVDRSGSMTTKDENPTGARVQGKWTRWNSAKVAAEGIAEVALSLDSDNNVEIMLWDGDRYGQLRSVYETMRNVGDISDYFDNNPPYGTTPLAKALDEIYKKRLKGLLQKGEPFTCIILTDGAPDDRNGVKDFFRKVVQENALETHGRETLAAFSFVRMGDDRGAAEFLENLDDNLIRDTGIGVDIVDTKEDNFLFGTGKYKGKEGVGPFALFWDAIYD